MSDGTSSDADNISINSELARLVANGVDVDGVIALTGYVGASPNEEVLRMYPGLEDLSVSIDIPKRDILRTMDAPTSTTAVGGVVIWVLRTTGVTLRRTRTVSTTAQQATGFLAGRALDPTDAGRVASQVGDRLNLQVSPRRAQGRSCWPCFSTCWSQCTMNCSHPPR